jgi:circadian clock protein KaiC
MNRAPSPPTVEKLHTGIPGFDEIARGGLPRGRTTLVAGTAGSGKTVFACQFLAAGVRREAEPGVFVTFEETADAIRQNMTGLGWDIARWEDEGAWAFVDAAGAEDPETVVGADYDFGGLPARIEYAVRKVDAKRVSLDSLGSVFSRFADAAVVRHELIRIVRALGTLGVTSVLTTERLQEYGPVSRHGVEDFACDNVIVLRHPLEAERRRRSLEILKFRGAGYHSGAHPFTITRGTGLTVIPLSNITLEREPSDTIITTGNTTLDTMCGGGLFHDAVTFVSGATGTGKSLVAAEFIRGGAETGDRCLLCGFEESRGQLLRNASGWGIDFEAMEREGSLWVECAYPHAAGLEEHLGRIKQLLDEFQPDRLVVDSLSALERIGTDRWFREFVIGLTAYIKQRRIAGLFTAATPMLMGGTSLTETHLSTLTDAIILLRYVEALGQMRRGITVLKMRGSDHEKTIREFTIGDRGMHIGQSFQGVTGILSGRPVTVTARETERVQDHYDAMDVPTPAGTAGPTPGLSTAAGRAV